ncbi:GNAT family N-acetyltransferase [Bacillus sp. AFS031507]|uniref:GNAT family N-acetyltransferase n=1 Tax=Bacillus sp. AFS031507 TaxID=2033496 RepID=UPI000BFC4BE9|nr:GNAT family N-acetyltransferase [Bacillus sp. AFS031507]PGY03454.1 GNAT family N-acetyltransferase [Bacillus sp. AFS031507]
MNIRKAVLLDVTGVAKVHVDSWKTTYEKLIPDEYISKLTYEKRAKLWEEVIPNGNVFVAEDDNGQIIGFADGGRERTGDYKEYKGEMYSIYILKSYQGQGIGKRLIKAVVNEIIKQDLNSMIVWVLKDNISCTFYEKMGGKVVDCKTVNFSGKELTELAYGWKDIRSL